MAVAHSMFFTLAVSAPDPATCAALTERACGTDPRVMPVPGPAQVIWRAQDGRATLITWGAHLTTPSDQLPNVSGYTPEGARLGVSGYTTVWSAGAVREALAARDPRSFAGTIWASEESGGAVSARTGITRVDPVFLARAGRATVLSDRATWAAAVTGRLGDADALLYAGLLGPGYPLGAVTPFTGVRALSPATTCHVAGGTVTETERAALTGGTVSGPDAAARVAEALVQAVTPLRDASAPVELSLTGGKDSRLIAAALARAGVPVRARTYGFADHPDVVVAAQVARELGLEHEVAEPRTTQAGGPGDGGAGGAGGNGAAAPGGTVQEVDVLGRLRATVLVADGMLSAFENVGRPDPDATAGAISIGGHGGELLRGGYAKIIPGSAARRSAASAELLRRLTMRRIPLLRARWRAAYLASLTPWAAAVAAHPQSALDNFYLVNRAGRWSAAARQAYAIRSVMAQPFFDDQVVRAARSAPLAERLDDRLVRGAIGALCPALLDIPLAADRWKYDAAQPPVPGTAAPGTAAPGQRARFDWRRGYGDDVAEFLRDYVLGTGSAGGLFAIVSRPAAERLLRPPHTDPVTVWALATLAALISDDWLSARAAGGQTFAIPVPA
jgi:Asparagine synthase